MTRYGVQPNGSWLIPRPRCAVALVSAVIVAGCEVSVDDERFGPSFDACSAITCGDGASCDAGACRCDAGLYGDPNTFCEDIESHQNWVGAPCIDDSECDFAGGWCLNELDGFPGGYCTSDCDRYCEDIPDAPITFCVAAPDFDVGQCVSRCDTVFYPYTDGCRPGYGCVERSRNGTDTREFVCLPN